MDRGEGAAPRPCGPSTRFPASGRQKAQPPFLGRTLAPGTWPGGSLPSGCGLRSDQARRWRPGTVARHIGWWRGRPKARGPAPPRAILQALTLRSRSESQSHWAPAATPDRESSPGGARRDLTARPTHCGSAGPGGCVCRAPGTLRLPPRRPSGERSAGPASRLGPAGSEGGPSAAQPPSQVRDSREIHTAFPELSLRRPD